MLNFVFNQIERNKMPEKNKKLKLTQHQKDRRKYKDLVNKVHELKTFYADLSEEAENIMDEIQQIKENQNVVPETEKFTDFQGHLITRTYRRDSDGTILFRDSYTNDRGLHESSHWQEYDADED